MSANLNMWTMAEQFEANEALVEEFWMARETNEGSRVGKYELGEQTT